jgi:GAF domain-containing protein
VIVKATRSKSRKDDHVRQKQAVALISRVAELCAADLPLSESLESLLNAFRPLVNFDAATLFLFDEDHTQMTIGASIGPSIVDVLGFLPLGPGHGLSGWVATHDKPVLLADRSTTSGFDLENDFASVAVLPLKTGNAIIGVLNIGCRKPGSINEGHVEALESVAGLLGLAVECLTGHKAVQTMREQLDRVRREHTTEIPEEPSSMQLSSLYQASGLIYHEINDALAIIVGNAQCFLAEQAILDQKTVSRVRRIEEAALRIRNINQKLPGLKTDSQTRGTPEKGTT